MKLSDFDYSYPKELIAQRPLSRRDASRMMVADRQTKSITHSKMSDLTSHLRSGDLLVVNDSKVAHARLFGTRANGEKIELLVVEPIGSDTWRCLLKKAKRIRGGEKFFFGMQSTATAMVKEGIFLVVEFPRNSLELAMKHHGVPPLPPYIERDGPLAYTDEDDERYQTIFAKNTGSAAAPTAGLHFSPELLSALKDNGIEVAHITLHVGIDTFQPMRKETLSEHVMHGERMEISEGTAKAIAKAKNDGRRVIPVGTTSMRAIESAAANPDGVHHDWSDGYISSGAFTTTLFITPGFKFRVADVLITNFHQPRSTLIVLVSAFAGREFILECYDAAIRERYRLFSYGDCMLIV